MKKKRVFLVVVISLSAHFFLDIGFAEETLPFQRKVVLDQNATFIAYPSDLCILEDESFVICDNKDQKIIIYDSAGKYLTDWSNFGQGPGEYQGIWFNSYQTPFLAVVDLRRPKILLYERISKKEFKWIKDVPESGRIIRDFILENGTLHFATTILHDSQYYSLHTIDLNGKNDNFLFPSAVRYGGKPGDNHLALYEGKFNKIWGLPWPFIDALGGFIYSTWVGDLRIYKIDKEKKTWISFGEKTDNYTPFKLEEGERQARQNAKQRLEYVRKERTKYSWVCGIFADKNIIGLLYLSFNKRLSRWMTFLQLYNNKGDLIHEFQLPDVIPFEVLIRYSYSRETGCLYVLNMIDEPDNDVGFEVLKYKVRE